MSNWKQQCFFCSDTVSTGTLNRGYYKMHMENVHGIQNNSEKLVTWALSQQNLTGAGKGGSGSTLSSVASILGMKGITITKDSSTPNGVPNSLINIKGITVQKVSDDIQVGGSPVTGAVPGRGRGAPMGRGGMNRPPGQQSGIARQQEQAIERWSNACEHGCRMCRREGKNFTTFHRNTLVRHLENIHRTSERDYKEEFKCQNLITRASNMSCEECKHRVKRIPSSLSSHLKKHGLTIRQYWIKHVAPKGSAIANYANGAFRGQPLRGGRGWARGGPPPRGGRGAMMPQFRGGIRPQIRPGTSQGANGQVNGNYQPKVMLNRVDDDTIKREEAGLGGDDAMEVELDPLTLLEMGMGEDFIQLEGVAVKEEVDSSGEGDDSTPLQITPDADDEDQEEDSRDLVTPEFQEDGSQEEQDGADDDEEDQGDDEKQTENEDIEVLADITAQRADPKTPIPLPDLCTPTKDKPEQDESRGAEEIESRAEKVEEKRTSTGETAPPKHSIGNILSSEHKDDKPGETDPAKQYSDKEHAAPLPSSAHDNTHQHAQQPTSQPQYTTTTPYTEHTQGFQQPPYQSIPPAGPPFQPFQGSHSAYAPFPPPFNSNYPPASSHGYPPTGYPSGPLNHTPLYPPVVQGNYQPPYVPTSYDAPKTRWDTLSCPYSIAQCPLYCCHVRGMQELEEGSTDWSRPYGPPASGFGDPCTCCSNT